MKVRTAYLLKAFAELDEAISHAYKINNGVGKHCDSKLEVHYDHKVKDIAPLTSPSLGSLAGITDEEAKEKNVPKPFKVMVMDEQEVPGGHTCTQCEELHFVKDDYLCSDCRAELG